MEEESGERTGQPPLAGKIHQDNKLMMMMTNVWPHLEFGNVVWSPRLEKDKRLVEGVQCRATKIIPGLKDLTYEQRLEKMKLSNICYRRLRGDLIEVFKYTCNIYTLSDSLLELETSIPGVIVTN